MGSTAVHLVALVHVMTRTRKGRLYVPVSEAEICDAIVRQPRMRRRTVRFKSIAAIHDGRQGLEIDGNRLHRILGERSAGSDDDGNRLTNIYHFAIRKHRPVPLGMKG